ncbi:MAG TPA: metalloregulator ArsR/SmtB family transcription factor [Chitinophagales bacterium]|nr:metalloregulator ArsR/SmtB family transcription factor [Chitinophagales bacterium]
MEIEQTKPKDFTDSQHEIAHTIKALGHPARVAIIEYLLSVDTCICGDIVDVLPLAQPTVSRHLKELKNAKLIKGTIEGNTICYCIDENTIEELQKYFTNISAKLTLKNNNCC